MLPIRIFRASLFCLPLLIVSTALAADMAGLISARQDKMKQMSKSHKALSDELQRDDPDRTSLRAEASLIASSASGIPKWFPRGSGNETGFQTRAKPEIWQQPQEFERDAKALHADAEKLKVLAASGNVDVLRVQFRAVSQGCKSCHDVFQAPRRK